MDWPRSENELAALQRELARRRPAPWAPTAPPAIGGTFVCFGRGGQGPGRAGDNGWAAAAVADPAGPSRVVVVTGRAGHAYRSGLLALREGPLLETAVRALPSPPDVLIVNATGRDHPRGAGLALHLGAVLGIPTVGVTHRPLLASGRWPDPARGGRAPLVLNGELVGWWLSTRTGARPLAVHVAWRTDPETAARVVLGAGEGNRTPQPLRLARQAARTARSRARPDRETFVW